jgi:F-type H+-transporting ATPase subunit epsilon
MPLQVQVVSPEEVLWSGDAERVITRTVGGGDIAFLPGHTSFMGALGSGVTEILQEGGDVVRVAIHGGFVEVSEDRVSLLSDTAEMASAIDVERARQAHERARHLLQDSDDEAVRMAMVRAETRIRAAEVAGEA